MHSQAFVKSIMTKFSSSMWTEQIFRAILIFLRMLEHQCQQWEFFATKKSEIDNKCSIVQTGEENLVLMIPLLFARLIKIAALNKLIQ